MSQENDPQQLRHQNQTPADAQSQESAKNSLPPKRGRVRRLARHLTPWTTTSLQAELDLQKQILRHTKHNARMMWQQVRERSDTIDETLPLTLWEQLGITSEAQLDEILLRWLKKRNFSLLVTILCGLLFLVSLFLGMPLLANIVCVVLMAEGGIEYMKASWYLYCLSNDTYVSFWSFLFGKIKG